MEPYNKSPTRRGELTVMVNPDPHANVVEAGAVGFYVEGLDDSVKALALGTLPDLSSGDDGTAPLILGDPRESSTAARRRRTGGVFKKKPTLELPVKRAYLDEQALVEAKTEPLKMDKPYKLSDAEVSVLKAHLPTISSSWESNYQVSIIVREILDSKVLSMGEFVKILDSLMIPEQIDTYQHLCMIAIDTLGENQHEVWADISRLDFPTQELRDHVLTNLSKEILLRSKSQFLSEDVFTVDDRSGTKNELKFIANILICDHYYALEGRTEDPRFPVELALKSGYYRTPRSRMLLDQRREQLSPTVIYRTQLMSHKLQADDRHVNLHPYANKAIIVHAKGTVGNNKAYFQSSFQKMNVAAGCPPGPGISLRFPTRLTIAELEAIDNIETLIVVELAHPIGEAAVQRLFERNPHLLEVRAKGSDPIRIVDFENRYKDCFGINE